MYTCRKAIQIVAHYKYFTTVTSYDPDTRTSKEDTKRQVKLKKKQHYLNCRLPFI